MIGLRPLVHANLSDVLVADQILCLLATVKGDVEMTDNRGALTVGGDVEISHVSEGGERVRPVGHLTELEQILRQGHASRS